MSRHPASDPGPDNDLWKHLSEARWFAGKGRPARLASVRRLPWLTGPGVVPAVRLELATVEYADGPPELYVLVITHRPVEDPASESQSPSAPQSPSARGTFGVRDLDEWGLHGTFALSDGTADPAGQAALWGLFAGPAAHTVVPAAFASPVEAQRFGGEQSNTSIRYGNDVLLKLFRRIQPGPNPEVEVLAALAGDPVAEPYLAELLGFLHLEPRTHLAMATRVIADARDGWEAAVEAASANRDFTAEAAALGVALRAVHDGLARAFGTGEVAGDRLATEGRDRLAAAVDRVPELEQHAGKLGAALDALGGRRIAVQRIHGDFHLGQALLTVTGPAASAHPHWTVIDFEGEPLKSLAERRAMDSPQRDLAGLLRSLDYAAGAARLTGADTTRTRAWTDRAGTAFLTGYAAESDSVLLAYIADKLAYEAVYEAGNRPDWLPLVFDTLKEWE